MGIPLVVLAFLVFYLILSRARAVRAAEVMERPFFDPNQDERRAAQLLRETLSAEQLEQFTLGRVVVPSQVSGFSYRVDYLGKISLITPAGESLYLCIRPYGRLPPSDRILTMLRHLQTNEIGLVKKASFFDRPDLRKHLLKELNRSQRPT